MSKIRSGSEGALQSSVADPRTWAVVFHREIRDLWIGGKALYLVLLHTVLLGIYSFLLASNAEVNLLPREEMISEIVKASIAVGLFICLIIGADSISGERERGTLEGVLLTPTSRRQILIGKLLAALSAWPVALAISVPYWMVLSKGDPVFWQALLWGSILGSLLAPAVAGVGMLVSIWCNSNKTSMLAGLAVYLLLLLPTEIARPGVTQTASEIQRANIYQWVNPWHGASEFLGRIIMFGSSPGEFGHLLTLPVIFPLLVIALLLGFASRGLRLDPGIARKLRAIWNRWRPLQQVPASQPASARSENPLAGDRAEAALVAPKPEGNRMIDDPRLSEGQVESSASGSTSWWLICKKELGDLWIGGKALNLIIAYTILLGVYTYMMARASAASVEPPKEMVFELLKAALMFVVFIGVIIGADSLSGERESGTLEGLLLTPVRRRKIVLGKFLAAVSPWPVALAISVPYFALLAQGDEVLGQAVFWGGFFGTALILGFTAFGMLVSFWCNNNKTSLFLSLGGYLLFLLPTQLTGHAQSGFMGLLFQGLNPMQGPRHFLATVLVNNRTPAEMWPYSVSAVVFALLTLAVLFWYASPGLRLEAGRRRSSPRPGTGAVAALLACLLGGGLGLAPAVALPASPSQEPGVAQAPLNVSISMTDTTVRAGGAVLFNTAVTNDAMQASPPLIVAMNIINLDSEGDVVDPEDWSPERTQYIERLGAGESATLDWRVNAILDGDYMVYMVVIPAPAAAGETSQPVASSGIHLTVTPYTRLNPGGVLPYVIGGPLLLGLIIFLVYRYRRRQIDVGGATD